MVRRMAHPQQISEAPHVTRACRAATPRRAALDPALAATLIVLPLRSDLGDISRALGCFVTDGPIGVTGYCMGAKFATRVAGLEPSIAACGGFHGARLATDEPDSPHLRLVSATAEFGYGHADKDRHWRELRELFDRTLVA